MDPTIDDQNNDGADQFGGPGLRIRHVHENGIHVLSTSGYVDYVTLGHLDEAVSFLSEFRPRRLVIDLSGLSFFSASGAMLLLAVNKRLGPDRLAVVIKPGHIAGKTTGIIDSHGELSVYETLREALAAS